MDESIGFHTFYVLLDYIETNKSIHNNNYLTLFYIGRRNKGSVWDLDKGFWNFNTIFIFIFL